MGAPRGAAAGEFMRRAIRWLFGALGYWTLFSAAVILFGCAVLVPELHDYHDLIGQRVQLASHVERLRGDLDRLKRAEAALPRDAAINERLARLQLGYRAPGEVGVWVPEPVMRPASVLRPARSVLPSEDLDAALSPLIAAAGRPKGRSLMLLMAAALLVIAVGIGLAARRKTPAVA